MTKTRAKEVLNLWKSESEVFSSEYSSVLLDVRLREAGFSQADAIAITMAMKLAGSNIKL